MGRRTPEMAVVTRRRASSVGPTDPWSEALLAVGVLGSVGGFVGLVVWASGAGVSVVTGHGVGPSPVQAGRRIMDGDQLTSIWPTVPALAVLGVAIGATALLSCAFAWGWFRWTARHPRRDGFASAA